MYNGPMNNKILLTGMPRSGKTTLLNKALSDIPNKTGFITEEIRKDGERTGFKIVTSKGTKAVLASIEYDTPLKVSKYCVDIEALDKILPTLEEVDSSDVLYIDEIGQMELFSKHFKNFTDKYLDSENVFIGTISKIFSNDFTKNVLARKDITVFEITEENRDEVYKKVLDIMKQLQTRKL